MNVPNSNSRLALAGLFLHGTTLTLLAFAIQELALLLSSHATEKTLTLLLLDLLCSQLALLGLLFLLSAAQLLNLLVADTADLPHHLATEVCGRDESVGEAQVLVEKGQSRGVAGGEVDGELDTLPGDGLVDPKQGIRNKG